jgi:disulfide bond formation protein DsbB
MRRQRSLALAALLLGAAACGAHAAAKQQAGGSNACPFSYSHARDNVPGGLLLSGVLHPNVDCKANGGAACPRLASKERNGQWVQECSFPTSVPAFGVCSEEQRAAGLDMAQKLHGGAALQASPCELFSYIRGRTLWLVGCAAFHLMWADA